MPATGVLVETLLDRGADADLAEAEAAIERLRRRQPKPDLACRDIWLMRSRALLARAHGRCGGIRAVPGSLPRHGEIP